MPMSAWRRILPAICLLALLISALAPRSAAVASSTQLSAVAYWGMNLYLTKRERLATNDNLPVLADTARAAGVQWTREELPWDLIEPRAGTFVTAFDSSLKLAADKGFGIIGMLLTTPAWARDGSCRPSGPTYWCPPARVDDYANFVRWMVERYDGDGAGDAPGSPRIAAWEIWNEPNDTLLWPDIGADGNARKRRYGDMLVAAYSAIKAADPAALVLTGGTYIYDGSCAGGICDGFNFFNAAGGVFQQVPDARRAFDVFAIDPYIPTDRPDAPQIPPVITVEGRIRNTRDWLNNPAIGRPDAPVWITEMGWCTSGGTCPGGVAVSEDTQANFLTRSMVIAQQNGVQHTSWFQFEDAFNNAGREWSYAAIVHDYDGTSYPAKPAYNAYRTLVQTLSGASGAGPGPVNQHQFNPGANQGDHGTYDYRYMRGSTIIDVLWRPADAVSVSFPVVPGKQITLVDRDGAQQVLSPAGGLVALKLSERPVFVIQTDQPRLQVAPSPLYLLAQVGASSTSGSLSIANAGGGTLTWSASASPAWLTLPATSGTAPATLAVRANTSGMAAGTYPGSITITGLGSSGSSTVPVSLRVASRLYYAYLPSVGR